MSKSWFPCLLTILNILCGFFTIIFVIRGDLRMAFIMIFTAGILDTIDGRIARYLNATSEFGKELDSLADLISFGIAPATMLYMALAEYGHKIIFSEFILPSIFVICGAIRLARYNVLNIKEYFVGVPIPIAGGFLLLFSMALRQQPYWIISIISLVLSFLMVSKIRVPRK